MSHCMYSMNIIRTYMLMMIKMTISTYVGMYVAGIYTQFCDDDNDNDDEWNELKYNSLVFNGGLYLIYVPLGRAYTYEKE